MRFFVTTIEQDQSQAPHAAKVRRIARLSDPSALFDPMILQQVRVVIVFHTIVEDRIPLQAFDFTTLGGGHCPLQQGDRADGAPLQRHNHRHLHLARQPARIRDTVKSVISTGCTFRVCLFVLRLLFLPNKSVVRCLYRGIHTYIHTLHMHTTWYLTQSLENVEMVEQFIIVVCHRTRH